MSENSAAVPGCPVCDLVAGTTGWTILEDEHWTVGRLPGLEVPGWTVLAQRRHAVGPAAMNAAEANALGPLLQRVAAAIEEATGAERVYAAGYGENAPHWHLLLTPRGSEVPPERRHVALWNHREDYLDPERADQVALELRERLTR